MTVRRSAFAVCGTLLAAPLIFNAYPAAQTSAPRLTTLYSFTGIDGSEPQAGIVNGSDGVLYGTTSGGGTSNKGTSFSLTPPAALGSDWTETVLHDFVGGGTDGVNPRGVVIGKGGVLYGTTINGGTGSACGFLDCGTVFSLTPPTTPGGAWTDTVLHNFTGASSDGSAPIGVVIGSGRVLYGTTFNGGLLVLARYSL